MQPKKQLKVQYICIFEEIDPPSFGQCPKENVFFQWISSLTVIFPEVFVWEKKTVQSHCYKKLTIITQFDQVNIIFERHYGIGSACDTKVFKVLK